MFTTLLNIIMFSAITIVAVNGTIFDGIKTKLVVIAPRSAEKLISSFLYCPLCIGFWVGLAGYFLGAFHGIGTGFVLVDAIGNGCIISVVSTLINRGIKL